MFDLVADYWNASVRLARRLNPLRRWSQSALTREGWYYLLVMAFVICGGLLRDINLLLVVAGMMAGPMFYNWRHTVTSLRGARLRRSASETVAANQPLYVDLRLANTSGRKTCSAVLVEETLVGSAGPARGCVHRGAALFGHIPPGEQRHAAYQLQIPQRGQYRSRALRASTRFPFGLVRRGMAERLDCQLTVFPQLGQLSRAWRDLQAKHSLGTRPRNRLGHQEGDFLGLRDWRPGDPRRWIHWRTSARRGSLVVRQFEQQDDEDLTLLLDLFAPADSAAERYSEMEKIIRFAATVAAHGTRRQGSRLRIVIGGTKFADVGGSASKDTAGRILEALAVAMPSPADPLPNLIEAGLDDSAQKGMTVVISPRQNQLANTAIHEKVRSKGSFQRKIAQWHWLCAADGGLSPYFQEVVENGHG